MMEVLMMEVLMMEVSHEVSSWIHAALIAKRMRPYPAIKGL